MACLDCAPASNPPSCATGAQGLDAAGRTKERRADKLCPAGVRQGPVPAGSSAPSGTPCLKPASGLLTPLTAAEAGRAACPSRPPRAPASGRALPARWQRGRRRKEAGLRVGHPARFLPARPYSFWENKASMPRACGTRPAFFRPRSRPGPEPGQSRARAGPDPLLNSSSPPRQSLRIPSEAPRRASDSLGQPRTGPGQPWAVPSRAGSSSCSSRQFPKSNAVTGSAGSRGPFRLQARDQLTHAGNEPMRKAEEARPAGTWSWRMALRHPQRPGGDAAQACRAWLRRLRQEQGPDLRRQDR